MNQSCVGTGSEANQSCLETGSEVNQSCVGKGSKVNESSLGKGNEVNQSGLGTEREVNQSSQEKGCDVMMVAVAAGQRLEQMWKFIFQSWFVTQIIFSQSINLPTWTLKLVYSLLFHLLTTRIM